MVETRARWGRVGAVAAAAVLLPVALWWFVQDDPSPAADPTAARANRGTPVPTTATPLEPAPSLPPAPPPTEPPPPDCPTFPADSIWHAPVTGMPVHGGSAAFVGSIGSDASVKADFGSGTWDGGPIGIPVTYVEPGQPGVAVSFDYADESDPGPYPIPPDAPVEGGSDSDGDRHVLIVDRTACRLYELWDAHPNPDGSWRAGSGATYDLRSNALRPAGWTSADAAGLPIVPGLVSFEEVATGRIDHPIRVTVPVSQAEYVWPARHAASRSSDPSLPPMGLRLRLRADVDITGLGPQAQVIAEALKTYGVVVADNGSAWYISGTPDERWDNDDLRTLGTLTGADFEAVDTAPAMITPDSAQSRQTP